MLFMVAFSFRGAEYSEALYSHERANPGSSLNSNTYMSGPETAYGMP
jgi:hypothetical protein